ncbi:BnaA01g34900D [Brassica napus]|uniref:BnaA01g34900D protein n=1 Tax=Brassica napus TaxID=3708 RepID=A0A078JTS7_BRANA|nr:BnaA01g34900D [Brassica napus]
MGERLKLILWICLSILAFLDFGAASKIGICYGRTQTTSQVLTKYQN